MYRSALNIGEQIAENCENAYDEVCQMSVDEYNLAVRTRDDFLDFTYKEFGFSLTEMSDASEYFTGEGDDSGEKDIRLINVG